MRLHGHGYGYHVTSLAFPGHVGGEKVLPFLPCGLGRGNNASDIM